MDAKRSAGVALKDNPENASHESNEARKQQDSLWLSKPGQTSPYVKNRGIGGPIKRTDVLQNNLRKYKIPNVPVEILLLFIDEAIWWEKPDWFKAGQWV